MDDREVPGEIRQEIEPGGAAGTSVPVVGVGASAGGLEVFKHLLAELPANTGLAIVFIQHLDPKHHSMLAEILGRTANVPVTEATDGMTVEADHVYVITANTDLTIAGGALRLAPRTQAPGSYMPIDRFLRSLADECGSRAIAVILSGAGSDGSAGVEAVKAAGGVTFAQELASAKFAAMPQAAIATGCMDFVLPPERIAQELVRIGRHPYIAGTAPAEQDRTPAGDEERYGAILGILHRATGIDFSLYREKMIQRRILRRLALRNIGTLAEYGKQLMNDLGELRALQRDLLIGVTSFFRDPESFESLKKLVFPCILQGRSPTDTIRIWVAGCATGEEAFSIAIALQEYLNDTGAPVLPVQIFASDLSTPAIEKARSGRYLENIAADLSHERLNRYFTRIDGGYQVDKKLREMCIFTRHNLIDDPPFSKLDLISCRNVLIYLGNVQKNIIPLFHYALKPSGFLMLGASEAAASADLFTVEDREHRIYSRRESARAPYLFQGGARNSRRAPMLGAAPSTPAPESWEGAPARKEVDRILLAKFSPPALVVDEELSVIEIRGQASSYLSLPVGKMSFDLVKLIPDTGLFLEVEKLIQRVWQSGEPARQVNVPYEQTGGHGELTVEAVPLENGKKRSVLVLFVPEPRVLAEGPPNAHPEADIRDRQISRLKHQLAEAKERLVSAIEEHETAREENQNTTEEALSANEELQSLNEELQTAKEELQSTNEELITVNDELQAKNLGLSQARDFAVSVIETVGQPLLVLDSDLRIRMANRAFYQAFQVSPVEAEGQVVYSLQRGSFDLPGLRESLDRLRNTGIQFRDLEVQQLLPKDGERRLLLAGGRIDHLKMILLALDDVTERRLAQKILVESQEQSRQAQKMEAVGRLAGGIAHDFNNLFTTILGYCDLLQETLAGNESATQQVNEIKAAGERAASLTEQLLAFSRRQVLHPTVLDLNGIVSDFDRMLRRLADQHIGVEVKAAPALWRVKADPGEIGRALMNLFLNARDAMPAGGTLTIETANVILPDARAPGPDLPPGRYVMVAVHDTGVGMDAAMQAHIFEPFFTTKEIAKGTGLGLATVQGIVRQSGGAIRCESELGSGTTFRLFLPAVAEAKDEGPRFAGGLAQAPKGSEVVLLVEGEDAVRKLARRILETSGYMVLDARNAQEGLALCETHQGPIDLLVTDTVVPAMAGRDLAEAARRLRPSLKVVFISGHSGDVHPKDGDENGVAILQMPFSPAALAEKVREALDSDGRPAEQG